METNTTSQRKSKFDTSDSVTSPSRGARTSPEVGSPIPTRTGADLIRLATDSPPESVIESLAYVGDVTLIHGWEESFKSIFIVQLAESLALGIPLLRIWNVPTPRIVGVVETEIHEAMLGSRLKEMFPDGPPPENMRFLAAEGMKEFRRVKSLERKLKFIQKWVEQEGIEVLVLDTVNDFFRDDDNPNHETDAGKFLDLLRNMNLKLRVLVRHDRKHKTDNSGYGPPSSNELIRGSAEWKEDPELILYLHREDKRTNEVMFEVGKFRYGQKPEGMSLWFDAGTFRLTPLPPVIALLEEGPKSRQIILSEGKGRFGLSERKLDEMLDKSKPFVRERQEGHQKCFSIDWERAKEAVFWGALLRKRDISIGEEICKVA